MPTTNRVSSRELYARTPGRQKSTTFGFRGDHSQSSTHRPVARAARGPLQRGRYPRDLAAEGRRCTIPFHGRWREWVACGGGSRGASSPEHVPCWYRGIPTCAMYDPFNARPAGILLQHPACTFFRFTASIPYLNTHASGARTTHQAGGAIGIAAAPAMATCAASKSNGSDGSAVVPGDGWRACSGTSRIRRTTGRASSVVGDSPRRRRPGRSRFARGRMRRGKLRKLSREEFRGDLRFTRPVEPP